MNKSRNFSIDPGLIDYWLSCFQTFTNIIFYYVGETPPDVQWRNREKRNHKELHEKARFFHVVKFWNGFFFCFVFKKTSSSLPMLFVHVGKRSGILSEAAVHRCSSKQAFLKICEYSQENTCVAVSS